jgi:hypothetical protein
MTTLSKTYPTKTGARRAIEALRATGVPARDIRPLTGRRLGDVRREPVGGFAGPVGPDAPVGTYGDRHVLRRQGAGSFGGDPAPPAQGSFADTDRVQRPWVPGARLTSRRRRTRAACAARAYDEGSSSGNWTGRGSGYVTRSSRRCPAAAPGVSHAPWGGRRRERWRRGGEV